MSAATPDVVIRSATEADIPFLAEIELIASTPPFPHSLWDPLVAPTGTATLSFLEAMFRVGALRWGAVEDFVLLEKAGRRVASCAVYEPAKEEADRRTLRLNRLPALAGALGWSSATESAFRQSYEAFWGPSGAHLEPHAPILIESVGVVPGARGRGLGRALMQAACDKAVQRGHRTIGVSAFLGNDGGRALYEAVGFEPVITYHAAWFGNEFPGYTNFRKAIERA